MVSGSPPAADAAADGPEEGPSSSLAALTRTGARAVQQLFRSGASAAPKAASKVAFPMVGRLPVRMPVKQVFSIADKSSQLMDFVDVAPNLDTIKESMQSKDYKVVLRRVGQFAVGVLKSGAAGIVVFEGYETLLDRWSVGVGALPAAVVPLYVPFVAGGVAGSAHAVLSTVFDSVEKSVSDRRPSLSPMLSLQPYRLLHHSSSHAILFGSYEYLKSLLVRTFVEHQPSSSSSSSSSSYSVVPSVEISPGDRHVNQVELSCVAIAGGFAGVLQSLTSHYLGVLEESGKEGFNIIRTLPRPPARTMAMAFLPSSLGFVAFNFGKEFAAAT